MRFNASPCETGPLSALHSQLGHKDTAPIHLAVSTQRLLVKFINYLLARSMQSAQGEQEPTPAMLAVASPINEIPVCVHMNGRRNPNHSRCDKRVRKFPADSSVQDVLAEVQKYAKDGEKVLVTNKHYPINGTQHVEKPSIVVDSVGQSAENQKKLRDVKADSVCQNAKRVNQICLFVMTWCPSCMRSLSRSRNGLCNTCRNRESRKRSKPKAEPNVRAQPYPQHPQQHSHTPTPQSARGQPSQGPQSSQPPPHQPMFPRPMYMAHGGGVPANLPPPRFPGSWSFMDKQQTSAQAHAHAQAQAHVQAAQAAQAHVHAQAHAQAQGQQAQAHAQAQQQAQLANGQGKQPGTESLLAAASLLDLKQPKQEERDMPTLMDTDNSGMLKCTAVTLRPGAKPSMAEAEVLDLLKQTAASKGYVLTSYLDC